MAFSWFKKKKTPSPIGPAGATEQPTLTPDEGETPLNGTRQEPPADNGSESHVSDDGKLTEEAYPEESGGDPVSTEKSTGFFQRLKSGLSKTRKVLTTNIDELFIGYRKFDEDMLEELEELLITSDIGIQTTMDIIESISKKSSRISNPSELKAFLKEELLDLLPKREIKDKEFGEKPHVVMVIGVNGVGKTTTIGKLAAKATTEGEKVLIAAADTFRAAAIEQLSVWADRAGAEIVRHKDNADPAAVAFDGVAAAMARDVDRVYIDTAGRLHTKTNLMEELKKIKRTISKKLPDAPHEILLVLDATTGQNAISQATMFSQELGISGIVLTKLDGTAKGGIVISICKSLGIPLQYIGVGESIEDLQDFDAVEFVDAIL